MNPVPALAFESLLDGGEPVAGIFWEPCLPVLRVFQRAGREVLIDVAHDRARRCRDVAALEGAERLEWSSCRRYGAIVGAGRLAVWNSQKNKVAPSPLQGGVIEAIAWRPNPPTSEGELWLAGSFGLANWAAEGGFSVRWQEPVSETTALAWDPAGTWLALACKRGGLTLWNARTNERAALGLTGEYPIRELAWSSSGAMLAGAAANSLFIWSIPAALQGKTHARLVRRINAPVSRLAFRPGSNILAVGTIDGGLELLRAVESAESPRCAQLGAPLSHVAWSPHGKRLAVATSSGQVHSMRVCK